jgi:membrane protein implicated in regulation of membrane protease activity
MIVRVKFSALRQSKWYEYVLRLGLGGLATVCTGVIANIFGPDTGGLFLAFPAIFFASATLIEKHERQRKQDQGLKGDLRGKGAAALDAAGAAWGSIGLAIFALGMWLLADWSAAGSLMLSSAAWLSVSVLLWRLRRKLRMTHRPADR